MRFFNYIVMTFFGKYEPNKRIAWRMVLTRHWHQKLRIQKKD